MIWRRIAYILYPLLVGALLPVAIFYAATHKHEAMAGVIRRAELSPDHPLIVRLALGRTTAISFSTRPEKVVPGNPQAVEINFLNRDLTLRPLGSKPGNLIVYTKSNRYVILFQLVSDTSYDDAVAVNSISSYSHPIRLTDDTFIIKEISLKDLSTQKSITFSALVHNSGKILESDSFPEGLRCKGCILKKQKDGIQLICSRPIQTIACNVNGSQTQLTLIGSTS